MPAGGLTIDALTVNVNDSGRSRAPIWPGVRSVLPAPGDGSETVKLVDGALLLGPAASSVMQEEETEWWCQGVPAPGRGADGDR